MSIHSPIQYLTQKQIDKKKWDACIAGSSNGLIYGYSFYLDALAMQWDALVLNDYEAVMPLTWNRKYGIKYLYQPPLTPQLGIFAVSPVTEKLIDGFIQQANKHFRFAEIFLNYSNTHPAFTACRNYVLPLNNSYDSIRSSYKTNLLRNLKKTEQFAFRYVENFNLQEALLLHQLQYSERTPHVKNEDYSHFEKLCMHLAQKKEVLLRAIFDKENTLLAVTVLLFKKNRLYLIEPTTLEAGKNLQANHFLIDAIIQEFSGKDIIFDMVGSDIPGIAQFYRNFGCIEQPFYFYSNNNLPWPLRYLK